MAWDPGCRSQRGALTISRKEAVPCQIQLDELFVANNWFNFFPSSPWMIYCEVFTARDLRVWNDNGCFMQIGFMLWIAYQLFREIISHYLLFWLDDRLHKSQGVESDPWRNSFQTPRELSVGPYACSEHKPSWKPTCRVSSSALRSWRCLVTAGKERERCLVWRAVSCLSSGTALWALFGSIFLTVSRGPLGAGRQDWTYKQCGGGWWMAWYGFAGATTGRLSRPGAWALSPPLPAATGMAGPWCSYSPGFVSAQEAANVCCVPYAVFQQEFVQERATSSVTVVALNRKWLIFHDYFSVRHDSWENASVWLAGENEPGLLSFKSKCSQALHANIPILDENSLLSD